jgi:hypothetical protein
MREGGPMYEKVVLWLPLVGAWWFGAVVGWIVQRAYQEAQSIDSTWLSNMLGVIGGGVVTALFPNGSAIFGAYAVGLGMAFFARGIWGFGAEVYRGPTLWATRKG